jgi:voltage-gated potassium channel Kch
MLFRFLSCFMLLLPAFGGFCQGIAVTKTSANYVAWTPGTGETVFNPAGFTIPDVEDDDAALTTADRLYTKAEGVVTLAIELNRNYYTADNFTVAVPITIDWLDRSKVSHSGTATLTVQYFSDGTPHVQGIDHYIVPDAIHIEVKAGAAAILKDGTTSMGYTPANIHLYASVAVEKILPMSLTAPTVASAAITPTDKGYEFEWTPIGVGQATFQVEWLHDNNLSETSYNFENNSSRVIITDNRYLIPRIYGVGKLLARVRAVGFDIANPTERIYSAWSVPDMSANTYGCIKILSGSEFEKGKNWDYSVAFDDNGKTTEAISYYDGTMRNRQNITRVNSLGRKTLVQSTIYDYVGRPAIQTLPAMDLESSTQDKLEYKDKFYRPLENTAVEYTFRNFDGVADPNNRCEDIKAGEMHPDYGADRYYTDSTIAGNENLPQSFRYPFSRVKYENSPLNRPDISTLPGRDHEINTGRVTKYIRASVIGSPLRRLFGNEQLGSMEKYYMEGVTDANKTTHLTYKDENGRVVATSIAGLPAQSAVSTTDNDSFMDAITVSASLIEELPNSNAIYGDCVELQSTIFVPSETDYGLEYNFSETEYTDIECTPGFCYRCNYTLKFSVIDECGMELINDSSVRNQKVGTWDTACLPEGGPHLFTSPPVDLTIHVVPGKYTVKKVLCIDNSAVEQYADLYVAHNGCNNTYTDYLDSYLESLNFDGCFPDCGSCANAIGEYTMHNDESKRDSAGYIYLTQAQYDTVIKRCSTLCNRVDAFAVDPCADLLSKMKAQLMPGGQYASFAKNMDGTLQLDSDGNPIMDTTDPYSAFYIPGSGQKLLKLYNDSSLVYPVDDPDGEVEIGNDLKKPNALSPSQFLYMYDTYPEWINELVKVHPEYCKYEYCVNTVAIKGGLNYSAEMEGTYTYAEALGNGFLNPVNSYVSASHPGIGTTIPANTTQQDPFAVSIGISNKLANINGAGKTLWQESFASANANGDLQLSDRGWAEFREYYLNEKGLLLDSAFNAQVTSGAACPAWANNIEAQDSDFYAVFDFGISMAEMEAAMGAAIADSGGQLNQEGARSALSALINQSAAEHCTDYIPLWKEELAPCGLPAYDLDQLAESMKQICLTGAAQSNSAFGASEVRGTVSGVLFSGNTTFESAIAAKLKQFNIPWSGDCNPYIINKPDGALKTQYGNLSLLDKCACDTITYYVSSFAALQAANSLPAGVRNINEYLQLTIGMQYDPSIFTACRSINAAAAPAISCEDLAAVYRAFLGTRGLSLTTHFSAINMFDFTAYTNQVKNTLYTKDVLSTRMGECSSYFSGTAQPFVINEDKFSYWYNRFMLQHWTQPDLAITANAQDFINYVDTSETPDYNGYGIAALSTGEVRELFRRYVIPTNILPLSTNLQGLAHIINKALAGLPAAVVPVYPADSIPPVSITYPSPSLCTVDSLQFSFNNWSPEYVTADSLVTIYTSKAVIYNSSYINATGFRIRNNSNRQIQLSYSFSDTTGIDSATLLLTGGQLLLDTFNGTPGSDVVSLSGNIIPDLATDSVRFRLNLDLYIDSVFAGSVSTQKFTAPLSGNPYLSTNMYITPVYHCDSVYGAGVSVQVYNYGGLIDWSSVNALNLLYPSDDGTDLTGDLHHGEGYFSTASGSRQMSIYTYVPLGVVVPAVPPGADSALLAFTPALPYDTLSPAVRDFTAFARTFNNGEIYYSFSAIDRFTSLANDTFDKSYTTIQYAEMINNSAPYYNPGIRHADFITIDTLRRFFNYAFKNRLIAAHTTALNNHGDIFRNATLYKNWQSDCNPVLTIANIPDKVAQYTTVNDTLLFGSGDTLYVSIHALSRKDFERDTVTIAIQIFATDTFPGLHINMADAYQSVRITPDTVITLLPGLQTFTHKYLTDTAAFPLHDGDTSGVVLQLVSDTDTYTRPLKATYQSYRHFQNELQLQLNDNCGYSNVFTISKGDSALAWEDIDSIERILPDTATTGTPPLSGDKAFSIVALTLGPMGHSGPILRDSNYVKRVLGGRNLTVSTTQISYTGATLAVAPQDIMVPSALTCQQSRCVSCERMDSLTSAFNRVLFANGQNHVMGNDIYYPMFSRYLSKEHLLYLRVQDIVDFIDTCQRGKIAIISPEVIIFNIFLDTINRSWPGLGPLSITPKLDLEEGTLYPAGTIFEHAALSDFSDNAHDMVYGIGYPPANTASCNPAFYRYYMELEDAGAHALRAVATGFHDQCGADLQLALIAPPDSIDADKLVSISGPYTPGQLELGTEPGDTMQMVYGNAVYLSGSSMPVRRVGFFMPDGRFPLYTWAYDTSLTLCSGPLRLNMQIPVAACYLSVLMQARQNAIEDLNEHRKEIRTAFIAQYRHTCLNNARESERLKTEHQREEYHFTLFYYDRAGQLVRTIPPQGVSLLPAGNTIGTPAHTMATKRTYNSLGQLVWEQSPDAGRVHYFYDRYGRMVASQSGRQAQIDSGYIAYSYMLYDAQSRVKEVGQIKLTSDLELTDTIAAHSNPAIFPLWMSGGVKSEITRTYYDKKKWPLPYDQDNLRNNIASTTYAEYDNDEHYDHATHCSYDEHGNIKLLVQEYPMLEPFNRRYFTLEYDYDLVSGNANKITYQKDREDQWIHRYTYNTDNELLRVETSTDGKAWYEDMEYDYYAHGALKREVLGNSKVQGTDYGYTIQGWLKGVNSGILNPGIDLGKDGNGVATTHGFFARDAFGYNLGYYAYMKEGDLRNDYHPLKFNGFEPDMADDYLDSALVTSMYNGNISRQTTSLLKTDQSGADVMAHSYRYDYIGRLARAHVYLPTVVGIHTNDWSGQKVTSKYKEFYHYDKNGNIKKLNREGDAGAMDELTYDYASGTNKLNRVDDAVSSGAYTIDIDDQSGTNYNYDADGNLKSDVAQGITQIQWNAIGKASRISKINGDEIIFGYGATGQRIFKEITSDTSVVKTYYVHDITGNILAVYSAIKTGSNTKLTLEEQHIYGSRRIGVLKREVELGNNNSTLYRFPSNEDVTSIDYYNPDSLPATVNYIGELPQSYGDRLYELSNHLGDVQSVISDAKIPVGTSTTLDHYKADVITMNDYYSFGMPMPGRNLNIGNFRFGYNTQERIEEISPAHFTAENWEYDTRVARRWNLDPIKFASISSYSVNFNDPISYSDPYGDIGGRFRSEKEYKRVLGNSDFMNVSRTFTGGVWHVSWDIKPGTRDKYDGAQAGHRAFGQKATGDIQNDIHNILSDIVDGALSEALSNEVRTTASGGEEALNNTASGAFAKVAVSLNPLTNLGLLISGQDISGRKSDKLDKSAQVLGLIPGNPLAQFEGQGVKTVLSLSNAKGIYIVVLKNGKRYVGMSINIARRLKQHLKKGKWTREEIDEIEEILMPGSTAEQRRKLEQSFIDEFGGWKEFGRKLINLRNAWRRR